jgi:hypothetical protein
MIKPTFFDVNDTDGWVRYSQYQKIEAENARLLKILPSCTEAADKRIEVLQAALRLYGRHNAPCPKSAFHLGYDFQQRCTCGFDEAFAQETEGDANV